MQSNIETFNKIKTDIANDKDKQGTQGWFAKRRDVTASIIGYIKGLQGSKTEIFRDKAGYKQPVSDYSQRMMDYGKNNEKHALDVFREQEGISEEDIAYPGSIDHPDVPWISASSDAFILWHGELYNVEVKCPAKRPIVGEIPLEYIEQMQCQMFVANAVYGIDKSVFIRYKNEQVNYDIVEYDEDWWENNKEVLEKFRDEVNVFKKEREDFHEDFIKSLQKESLRVAYKKLIESRRRRLSPSDISDFITTHFDSLNPFHITKLKAEAKKIEKILPKKRKTKPKEIFIPDEIFEDK